MPKKTNNLDDLVDKIIDDLIQGVHYEKTYPAHTAYYQLDFKKMKTSLLKELKQFILKREKALINKPMGVSAWRNHGKKYQYDKYFQKALIQEIVEKIEEMKNEEVREVSGSLRYPEANPIRPNEALTMYIQNQTLKEVLKILKAKLCPQKKKIK